MNGFGAADLRFAGSRVRFEWDGPVGESVVRLLFPQAGPITTAATPLSPKALLRLSEHRRRLRLDVGDQLFWEGRSTWRLGQLVGSLAIQSIVQDGSGDGAPLFHAAAACRNGLGLLLPGAPRAGKTTLSAWLGTQGFRPMGDELAMVRLDDMEIEALARAWHFRPSGAPAVRALFPATPHLRSRSGAFYARRVEDLERRPAAGIALRWIVFPEYRRGVSLDLRRLTGAQAGLRLMGQLVNAPGLGAKGVTVCARIARGTPAWSLRYSRFDQLSELVATLTEASA